VQELRKLLEQLEREGFSPSNDPQTRLLVRELARALADRGQIQLAWSLYHLSCACLTLLD